MKDILKITVEYFYDIGLDLEVRAAALYTLYAIYFHQMNRPKMKVALLLFLFLLLYKIFKFKISVTPQQWISILQFIDIINQAEHVDVEYCFRYLLYSDAFEFCSVFETVNYTYLINSTFARNNLIYKKQIRYYYYYLLVLKI